MPEKSLVLAEKPSVARDIAKILGARKNGEGCIEGDAYIVTWALGHLVALADPEEYGEQYKTWRLDTLPMLPDKMRLTIIKESAKQFRNIQALLKRNDVKDIIIATDSGREGELVARWILLKAGCKKPTRRLWISSQTAKAVKEGFASLKPGREYDNLYLSAQARAEADWLVGLNVTRALTCKFNAQLSGGRVQTPTLALVVAREQEIRDFKPRDYFSVKAKLAGFTATWIDKKQQSRLFERDEAEAILQKVQGQPALVTELAKQYKQTPPPAAYDLTELQRDANRKYAYSAKETLSYMQSLYEYHKLLTYPRTDSRYITEDVAATLPERIKSVACGPYRELAAALLAKPLCTRHIVNAAKVTDHHAIIPTEQAPNLLTLPPEERNIYDLVVRRFLAVLSPAFEYEETKLLLSIGGEKFSAKGKTVKSAGWKAVYGASAVADDSEEEDHEEAQTLPALRQGDRLPAPACGIVSSQTKAPARYTEATLLSAMESPRLENKALHAVMQTTSGLGTPATRAEIIEKLFSSFYMERRGKEIVPTSKGIQLVSLVPPDLKSAELTAQWEQQLALISKGQAKNEKFINDMRAYAAKLVSAVIASNAVYHHDNQTRDKCPDCGQFLLRVKGKKGEMLVCPDRECGYRKNLSLQTNARCPNCHKKLELRGEGEKRMFVCVCGHREKLADFEKRRDTAGANKNDVKSYLDQQKRHEDGNFAMQEALAKWQEKNKR